MSQDEKELDRLSWRAWATNRKLENMGPGRALERHEHLLHLASIEDGLEAFPSGGMA